MTSKFLPAAGIIILLACGRMADGPDPLLFWPCMAGSAGRGWRIKLVPGIAISSLFKDSLGSARLSGDVFVERLYLSGNNFIVYLFLLGAVAVKALISCRDM